MKAKILHFKLIPTFIMAIVICSCSSSEDIYLGPTPGIFVLDSLYTSIIIQENPMNNNIEALCSLDLIYRFENRPGTIDYIGFNPVESDWSVDIFNNYFDPLPNSKEYTYHDEFYLPETFEGIDSVTVDIQLKGSFWRVFIIRDGKKRRVKYYGPFEWNGSMRIPVERVESFKGSYEEDSSIRYKDHDFIKNDVIKVDKKIIKISKLGKIIYGINIRNNKSVSIDLKDKEYKVLKQHKTSVTKIHPNVEVLHPDTYQSIRIENKADLKPGEKVNVVMDDGNIYIIS